ncbi:hypothetical protein LCGC14_0728300 [marine sediment metagenome]|uniref:Uncharacterized protein n=1 Tax=marine sediment metagenome TaxID=412755 RepID=A0A0F9QAF7_9ZZZZ
MRQKIRTFRYYSYRMFCKIRYRHFPEVPLSVAGKLWALEPDKPHLEGKTALLKHHAEAMTRAGHKVRCLSRGSYDRG